MKVIDLLIKLANDEIVPNKIKFQDKIYHFNREYMDYESDIEEYRSTDVKEPYYIFSEWCPMLLNDEVEIIKEDKEIKQINKSYPIFNFDAKSFEAMKDMLQDVYSKQCELIDVVNELRK